MRARNVKPGLFKNDILAECPPLARILFVGLWCQADREGRLEDRPKRIKAEILPYDACDVDDLLNQLAEKGFILRYRCADNEYIQVLNFQKHQNPHVKEAPSTIPAPGEYSACTVQEPENHGSGPADSGFRIPDPVSRIPEVGSSDPLSGKPDDPRPSPPYTEIIHFLNEKTGKRFDPRSRETQKLIKARWNAGHGIDAFKRVIENKAAKWGTDPKMVDFLRPQTLFGTKFEAYLNERPHPLQGVVSQKTIQNITNVQEWIDEGP